MPYLKCVYTYKKINKDFLKFYNSLLRIPNIMEIGSILPAETLFSQKHNQRAYSRFRPR